VHNFSSGKEALQYLEKNISGREAILFKGSQSLFLEGIIEHLLNDKTESDRLPRRGEFWDKKRQSKGY